MIRALLLVAAVLSSAPALLAAETDKPNIVLFLVDDMGWQDTSVPFHTEVTELNRRYHTPNMERLAASGMKFTQAYACSVCSPTRVSLMTGLNAARHRVTNWTLRKNASNDRRHPTLAFPKWNVNGLSPQAGIERTVHAKALPAFLREGGYRTIHVGKAHLGAIGTPGADPLNIGFDVNIGGHAAGGPGSFLGTQNFSAAWRRASRVWDVPGLEKHHGKEIFLTEALTIEASQAVDQAVEDGKPFFLYMSHYAVHVPFAKDARFYQKYRDAGLDHTEAMYAAMVEGMDKSLGDILDNIERHGLSDNTIVLFMSDNGGLSAQGRGGKPHTHNKPLSSGKGSAHEGGVRVPMIVRWPGVAEPSSIGRQPVMIEDFFPTILEMAGLPDAQQVGGVIDGRSFVPLLRGEKDDRWDERSLFWHFPNNWGPRGPGIGPSSSIRRGPWKLIYYYDTQRFELFHIAEDIEEEHDLADEYPDLRDSLAGELRSYLRDVQAQFPIDKKSGQPVLIPGAVEMTRTDVFVSGMHGYHTYRIPAVIVTKNGSLLAFCEGRKTSRSDHGDLDLVLRRSTDNGQTWGPLQIVYEEGGDARITIGNPCPVVDRQSGRIWLPFCRDNDDVLMTYSDDDGKTWAKPREITSSVKQPDWGWYATGPGVGIQLSQGQHQGRLVIPCDHRIKSDAKRVTYSHAIYSDDHGETWMLGGTVAEHTNECQVVELRDGTLMMNMRNYWGRDGQQQDKDQMRAVALSRDGGATWGDLRFDRTLVEPICQASLFRYPSKDDRDRLLFSNPASKSARHRLTVRLSNDAGETWPAAMLLHEGPSAYSCLTVLPDGSIGCLYEGGKDDAYDKIIFARFPLKMLEKQAAAAIRTTKDHTRGARGQAQFIFAAAPPKQAIERQNFTVDGRPAFIIAPTKQLPGATPWVLYAPTLGRGLPGGAETWMFRQFLDAGMAIAGVDVGESYGSPKGRATYHALHKQLTEERGFAQKACLLARSRGGLMLYCWAAGNPEKVNCIAGIYPVCNLASYPGLKRACGAYGMTESELAANLAKHNPVDRLTSLAKAGVPIFHIHGDVDRVVPLDANSGLVAERYRDAGGKMELKVAQGQGHNMWKGFFECQELVDFVIRNATSQEPRIKEGR